MYSANPDDEESYGKLAASFIGHNHFDEVAHAYSVCAVGDTVVGGYNQSNAKIFDMSRPGKHPVVEVRCGGGKKKTKASGSAISLVG